MPPLDEHPHSSTPVMGSMSLMIGFGGIVGWFLWLLVMAWLYTWGKSEQDSTHRIMRLVLFAGLAGNCLGVLLGALSLCVEKSKKIFGLRGLLFNLLELIGILLMVLAG